jgi:hypothetical protein
LNPDATFAIETSDLVKTFGDTRAVDRVDLAVPKCMSRVSEGDGASLRLAGKDGPGRGSPPRRKEGE